VTACLLSSPLKQLSQSETAIGPLRILVQYEKNIKNITKPQKVCCCGGAEESTAGDGNVAATVVHAVKGGGGEEEKDVDAAAALPHALAPVEAPNAAAAGLYCEWRGYS
jgi:hypothetical protein